MAISVAQLRKDLQTRLGPVRDVAIADWGVKTSRRIQRGLQSSIAPAGNRVGRLIPPNTSYTSNLKRKHGLDPRPGVRAKSLMGGLGNTVRALTKNVVEVYGSDGKGRNDLKANLLIKGQTVTKRGKTHIQIPRPYVDHDEAVVEDAAAQVVDLVLKAWRF